MDRNRNFGQKSKFSTKIEILNKNLTIGENIQIITKKSLLFLYAKVVHLK